MGLWGRSGTGNVGKYCYEKIRRLPIAAVVDMKDVSSPHYIRFGVKSYSTPG